MKRAYKHISLWWAGLCAAAVWYAIVVFISLQPNPFDWPPEGRGLFAFFGMGVVGAVLIAANITNDNRKHGFR